MNNLEFEVKPENLAEKALGFYADTLESFSTTFEKHDVLKRDAQVLGVAADTLRDLTEGQEIESAIMMRRTVRPQDDIDPGEHPGSRIKIQYKNGVTVNINMYGGMGREFTESDVRDHDINREIGHAQRTEVILDKKSHMGIVVNDENGVVVFNSWINHIPGKSISVAPFSFTNPNSGTSTTVDGWLNMQSSSNHPQTGATEKYLCGQLSSTYKDIQSSLVRATPKPKVQ